MDAILKMNLPYTQSESQKAHREWKASCGHHSIAAATNRSLDDVRKSGVKLCGWMNPRMVSQCLSSMEVDFHLAFVSPQKHPYMEMVDGNQGQQRIFRVQFTGPWMDGPVAEQYRHTHYIACLQSGIVDPILNPCKIMQHEDWWDIAEEMYQTIVKRCEGYHFSHVWNVSK